jgi:SulP family sulfate permease
VTRFRSLLARLFSKETLKDDAIAGVVLGVESVPDGLAGGLLAGVNPVFGLYAYMVGTFTGALFTSSAFMGIQATGAMAMVIADIPEVHTGGNEMSALFTLSILVGLVMLVAGLFKLGSLLRFVSNAVMVGFLNAVGVNIILGQLDNFTGYEAEGSNRVVRAFDLLLNLGQVHLATVAVGIATIVLIITLERTRLGPLGLVVAVIVGSAIAPLFGWDVLQLGDIADIPRSLPLPMLPEIGLIPALIAPAIALAFVGLVQGAGISANFPNPDGKYPDASQDFIGQGAANVASGFFQGMPVGGSMSATSLVKTAGAKSRQANLIAGLVIAVVVVVFGWAVGYISMAALAGLLIIVGFRTIKPDSIKAVWRTGAVPATVMTVTFVLTMLIPLTNAVLAGVGISVILYVVQVSNKVQIKRWVADDQGRMREVDPPSTVGEKEVLILQPYGSLFFAAAAIFEEALPEVTEESRDSVVILRLRGKSDLGSTFMEVLFRYAKALQQAECKLMIVSASDQVLDQLRVTGVATVLGSENLYPADEYLGKTVARALADAEEWVASN